MGAAPGPYVEEWCFDCDGSAISIAATPRCSLISVATVGRSGYLLSGDGREIWKAELDFEGWSTAITTDGKLIAFGTANKNPSNGTVFVFDQSKIPVWSHRLNSPVWGVSFSADGSVLAASCWNNKVYIFTRQGAIYSLRKQIAVEGRGGLYGIKLTRNGEIGLVCSYDSGIIAFDQERGVIDRFAGEDGFYNIALFNQDEAFVAGSGKGRFLLGTIDALESSTFSPQIAQRPVCGISASGDGEVVATGSFDGRVLLASSKGDILWELETLGEVWSTAMSHDGGLVCIGSGDHTVRLVRSYADSGAVKEIIAAETVLEGPEIPTHSRAVEHLVFLYLKFGVVDYGVRRLQRAMLGDGERHLLRDQLRKLLTLDIERNPFHYRSHYDLGCLLIDEQRFADALRHLQQAARLPALKSMALRRAANCFAELRFPTAMRSAFTQAREQHLDNDAKQVLFNLALSFEHAGEWKSAKSIYELLVSWDIAFRNVWDKLDVLGQLMPGHLPEREDIRRDYTGLTTSLLGPDAPRDVDPSLKGVLTARAREVPIDSSARAAVEEVVSSLLDDARFSMGIRRDLSALSYDLQLFLKYDYGLPEDEMKKFLETVNAFPHIEKQLQNSEPKSLDIGSATGRYPFLLTRLGFRASGIDIEDAAIQYSTRKAAEIETEAKRPRFVCGDICQLDNHISSHERFNVITCMMGTLDHIPLDKHIDVLKTIRTRLAAGGVAIISVWDIECRHLAYLSIYDERQRELIRKNSPAQDRLKEAMLDVGFDRVVIEPFCLLPQVVIYDLGLERMAASDIGMAVMADLSAKTLYRDRHGEMYLAIGYSGQETAK